ncbi:MAG: hypothetical protein AB7F86_16745 [Bdellovibrionales bacterium]
MEINSSPVSRCLDKKMVIFGFEVPDLLLIFLTLSVLNYLFGTTSLKIVLVWLPSLALALTLWLGKRGKPENFLVHWIRFQIAPGHLSAFQESSEWALPPRLKKGAS